MAIQQSTGRFSVCSCFSVRIAIRILIAAAVTPLLSTLGCNSRESSQPATPASAEPTKSTIKGSSKSVNKSGSKAATTKVVPADEYHFKKLASLTGHQAKVMQIAVMPHRSTL